MRDVHSPQMPNTSTNTPNGTTPPMWIEAGTTIDHCLTIGDYQYTVNPPFVAPKNGLYVADITEATKTAVIRELDD